MTRWHQVSQGNRTALLGTIAIYLTSSPDAGVFPTVDQGLWIRPFPAHAHHQAGDTALWGRDTAVEIQVPCLKQRYEYISEDYLDNVWISNWISIVEHVETKRWTFSKYTETSIPPFHREVALLHIPQALPYWTVLVPPFICTWKPSLGHLQ